VQRRGAAARRAAAHLIRTHTHGGYATHWRPTRADSAPAAGFGARVQCQRVQSGYVQQPARWLCCVGCDRAGEADLVHCAGRSKTHLGWLRRHAPRAKWRRWDRGQSYRYLGRAAHRFATHQRLDIPVHLFGTEFWAASLNGRLRTGRRRGSGRAGSKRVEWRTNEYPCADTAALFRRRRASRRPRRCRRFAHFGL